VIAGSDPDLGTLIDAVQAMTGATFGSGRLRVDEGSGIVFEYGAKRLIARPRSCVRTEREMLRRRAFEELFDVAAEDLSAAS
jgi:hypothetical protein